MRRLDRRSFVGASMAVAATGVLPKAAQAAMQMNGQSMDMGGSGPMRKPGAPAKKDPVDSLEFGTPKPQPGGVVREYWISAASLMWDIAPTGRDDWMKMPVPRKTKFRAFA